MTGKLEKGHYTIIPTQILEDETILQTPTEKLLLLTIWSFTFNNEDNKALLSDKLLLRRSNIKRKETLYKELQSLKDKGLITTQNVKTQQNNRPQREITLNLNKVLQTFYIKFSSNKKVRVLQTPIINDSTLYSKPLLPTARFGE